MIDLPGRSGHLRGEVAVSTWKCVLLIGLLACSTQTALADGDFGSGRSSGDGWWQARIRADYLSPSSQASTSGISGRLYPEASVEWALGSRWSLEAAIGTPARIDDSINMSGERLSAMPSTLTGKFGLAASDRIRPYVGVGIHYTVLTLDHAVNNDAVSGSRAGIALQAGLDTYVSDGVLVGLDLRYLTNVKLSGRLGGAYVSGDLNPFIVGIGVGYRWR
jgi:outer membrane protein